MLQVSSSGNLPWVWFTSKTYSRILMPQHPYCRLKQIRKYASAREAKSLPFFWARNAFALAPGRLWMPQFVETTSLAGPSLRLLADTFLQVVLPLITSAAFLSLLLSKSLFWNSPLILRLVASSHFLPAPWRSLGPDLSFLPRQLMAKLQCMEVPPQELVAIQQLKC